MYNNMDNAKIKASAVKFSTARSNLLLVVLLTIVNVVLHTFGSTFHMFFSSTMPMIAIVELRPLSETFAYIAAFFIIFAYFMCWWFSKRTRAFILVALIIFSLDTLLFLLFIGDLLLFGIFEFAMVIGLIFHGWILYYLITGTVAWSRLQGVTNEQLEGIKAAVDNEIASNALKDISDSSNEGQNKEG